MSDQRKTPFEATNFEGGTADRENVLPIDPGTPEENRIEVVFTVFPSKTETIGRTTKGPFYILAKRLTNPLEANVTEAKEDLPQIAFVKFRGNRRRGDFVETSHALVLDYDNEHEVETGERDPRDLTRRLKKKAPLPSEQRTTPESALALWPENEVCLYTSWSHTAELPKFRVIVPFGRGVSAGEFQRVARWARSRLAQNGHVVDPASFSAAHPWYIPRKRKDRPFLGEYREGRPLDIDAILARVPEDKEEHVRTKWGGTRRAAYVAHLESLVSMEKLCQELGIHVHNGKANLRGEKTPSAHVYESHIHDFGSHKTWYPRTLVQYILKLDFVQAVNWLASWLGVEPFDWRTADLPEKVDPTAFIEGLEELPELGWIETVQPAIDAIATQDESDWEAWIKRLAAKTSKKKAELTKLVKDARKAKIQERKAVQEKSNVPTEYTTNEDGWLCADHRPIANFAPKIDRVVMYNDAFNPRTEYVISGKLASGDPLPTIQVDGNDFGEMKWILPMWGGKAFFTTERTSLAGIRDYMLRTSTHEIEVVHTSLGWTKIDGQMVYLHAGGYIGGKASNAQVKVLGEKLAKYLFPETPKPEDLKMAVRRSLDLLTVAGPEITYVPYAAAVSAPALGLPSPRHTVAMIAPSMSGKTTFAMQLQSHYGALFSSEEDAPLNYQSSVVTCQYITHAANNALVLVDDARPRTKQRDWDEQKAVIEFIARRQSREKANRDGTPRPSRTPRSNCITTWEMDYAPVEEGESTSARILKVFFKKGDLKPINKTWNHAGAMRGYIEYIASNWKRNSANNGAVFLDELKFFREQEGLLARQPEDLAYLMAGFYSWMVFALEVGAVTKAEFDQHLKTCREALLQVARAHQQATEAASHENRYLDLVSSAIQSGRFRLLDDLGQGLKENDLGWYDENKVYLHPTATHAALLELAKDLGEAAPLPLREIFKRMVDKGLASPPSEKDRIGTRINFTRLNRPRVIEISRDLVEGLPPKKPSVTEQELSDLLDDGKVIDLEEERAKRQEQAASAKADPDYITILDVAVDGPLWRFSARLDDGREGTFVSAPKGSIEEARANVGHRLLLPSWAQFIPGGALAK